MNVRSRFDRGPRVQLLCLGEGKTRQSFTDECDINQIMAKFQKTGAIDHFSRHSPRYDFADAVDFHGAMNIVSEAQRMFDALPSSLRNRFREPGDFLDFVQDEANGEEMRRLGLREPEPSDKPLEARSQEAPAVAPPEAPAAGSAAEASD